MTRPFFTVGILAYNRAALLPGILDSILAQDFADYEILVAEDASPEAAEIRAIVERYAAAAAAATAGAAAAAAAVAPAPHWPIRLHQHATTVGYDANLRTLVAEARGQYVLFLGNDDYLAPGALRAAHAGLTRHPETGGILRSWAGFREDRQRPTDVSRYVPSARVIPAGRAAILASHRRFVPLAGIVLHRDDAHAAASAAVDGALFYQQWLSGHVLAKRPLLCLPDVLVQIQLGSVAAFGSAEIERRHFTPGPRSLQQDVRLVEGLFTVGDALERSLGIAGLGADIRRDFARRSYPTLELFAQSGRGALLEGYGRLGALGLRRFASFHLWFVALLLAGPRPLRWMIRRAQALLGHTPSVGSALQG
jgi:hypothetical protein